ncbi:phage minor capsid protein [Nonomuraea indica]|uniref:phage minor capsid protein n=1 Tax=Nonomuraea indica TaxID=1581193 RepID=UPI000C7B66BD|nr:phage minor capsid protein [Nonomuraea indica]
MAAPTVDDLVTTLLDLYTGVEQRIARDIATSLQAGLDSPDWAADKLAALGQLRQRTERVLARLGQESDDRVRQVIALAAQRGGQQALRELHIQADAPLPDLARIVEAIPGVGALVRLARELALTLRSTHVQILRWALDVYREVIARTALPDVLLGVQTRRQAAQRAWEQLLDRGVTGFQDRAGRRWQLASYVEMAVRTGALQAMRQAHADRLADEGEDLVIVSDSPRECGLCRPWERKVLSISGRAVGRVQVEHATEDRMMTVTVSASLAAARVAGLFHPNCTHSVSAYLPGVTKVGSADHDPAGYEAKQRQRAIERHIRRWKLRAAGAIDPAAKRKADGKVRKWQTALRQHIAEHGLKRLRYREQVGRAR